MSYRVHRYDNTTGSHFQGVQSAAHQRKCLCAAHPSSEVLTQLCWWGLFIQVLLSMEQPCGIGDSYSLGSLCSAPFPSTPWCSLIGMWVLTFFPKCHFPPALLLWHSEMLLSSGCSDRASSFLEGKRELVNSYLCA